jgi:hypothetical protein
MMLLDRVFIVIVEMSAPQRTHLTIGVFDFNVVIIGHEEVAAIVVVTICVASSVPSYPYHSTSITFFTLIDYNFILFIGL